MQVHSDGARSSGHSQVVQAWSGDRQHNPLSGEGFFDPGNAVYYLAFYMIWPGLLAEYGWNVCFVGDIWESLLGFAYLHLHQSQVPQSAAALAHWIIAYIFKVYRFVCYANHGTEWWHPLCQHALSPCTNAGTNCGNAWRVGLSQRSLLVRQALLVALSRVQQNQSNVNNCILSVVRQLASGVRGGWGAYLDRMH